MSSVAVKVYTNPSSPGREGGLIEDLWCMMLISLYTDVLFFFLFFWKTLASSRPKQVCPPLPTLCWRSINPPRFILYHTHLTDSVNRLMLIGHFHNEHIGLQLPKFNLFCF